MKTVYLAGPISGLAYAGAVDWREAAVAELAAAGIKGLSPMRCKDYLSNMADLEANCREYGEINVLSSPRGITARDRFDATRCDVLLVNLLGAERVTVGTMIELGWADASRIPIVCAMEKEGNLHDHAMVNTIIDFRLDTLGEALNTVKAILQ
jgi:nucleoside 2-deoxyribosyltransferase